MTFRPIGLAEVYLHPFLKSVLVAVEGEVHSVVAITPWKELQTPWLVASDGTRVFGEAESPSSLLGM